MICLYSIVNKPTTGVMGLSFRKASLKIIPSQSQNKSMVELGSIFSHPALDEVERWREILANQFERYKLTSQYRSPATPHR